MLGVEIRELQPQPRDELRAALEAGAGEGEREGRVHGCVVRRDDLGHRGIVELLQLRGTAGPRAPQYAVAPAACASDGECMVHAWHAWPAVYA